MPRGRPRKIHPFSASAAAALAEYRVDAGALNEQQSTQIPKQVSEVEYLREENLKLKEGLHNLEQELLDLYRRVAHYVIMRNLN